MAPIDSVAVTSSIFCSLMFLFDNLHNFVDLEFLNFQCLLIRHIHSSTYYLYMPVFRARVN